MLLWKPAMQWTQEASRQAQRKCIRTREGKINWEDCEHTGANKHACRGWHWQFRGRQGTQVAAIVHDSILLSRLHVLMSAITKLSSNIPYAICKGYRAGPSCSLKNSPGGYVTWHCTLLESDRFSHVVWAISQQESAICQKFCRHTGVWKSQFLYS